MRPQQPPPKAVKIKGRTYEFACNSANVTFLRASDARWRNKPSTASRCFEVTLISGGGRRKDNDPEHDFDDMDDEYADTHEVDSYDDMEYDY